MTKLPFHCDPGHAWLEVTPEQLLDVGLNRASFTTCSYVSRDGRIYLEEVCDAGKFIKAFADKYGRDELHFQEVMHRGEAPCRRMRINHEGAWKPFEVV